MLEKAFFRQIVGILLSFWLRPNIPMGFLS